MPGRFHKNPPPLQSSPLLHSPRGLGTARPLPRRVPGLAHASPAPLATPRPHPSPLQQPHRAGVTHLRHPSRPRPAHPRSSLLTRCAHRVGSRLAGLRARATRHRGGKRERGGGSGALTLPRRRHPTPIEIPGHSSNPRRSPRKRSAAAGPAAGGETRRTRAGRNCGPRAAPTAAAVSSAAHPRAG